MAIKSVSSEKEINWEVLQRRFPVIAFALCYEPFEKISCFYDGSGRANALGRYGPLHADDIAKEMVDWKSSLVLEGINVLYVYGIGLGHFYQEIAPWLQEKEERKVIFFEEDLAVLDALFSQELGDALLSDPKVHIYYVPQEKMWPQVLEECVQKWISDRLEWTTLPSYLKGREKKSHSLRLKLMRRSTCVHAKVSEVLHYHLLMQNIASNLLHLPKSFHANRLKGAFKNVPAVICGAGSTLQDDIPFLKGLETKALVIAGGSAITALGHYGIRPHIAMAVDPNEEEHIRLKTSSCFETPFIYSSRLHKEVLDSTHMQMGYLCSNTGGVFEAWVHEKLGIHSKSFALELGEEALSVTTLAAAFAAELGCNPIIFSGVDLSYSNKSRYCAGVVASSTVSLKELDRITRSRDRVIRRKNSQGEFVHTLIKWVMEAACLGAYAKKRPAISFFNLSTKGLPMKNIEATTQEKLLDSYLQNDYDLRGRLYQTSQELPFPDNSKASIENSIKELQKSFETSLELCQEMIQEIRKKKNQVQDLNASLDSGKMSVIEMDLVEEPAYQVCLQSVFSVYQGILQWIGESAESMSTREERDLFLKDKEKLWESGKKVAEECISFLKNY